MSLIFGAGIIGLVFADQYDFIHKFKTGALLADSPRDLKTVQDELGQTGRGMPAESKIIKKQ